jgi:hypothetical protein
MHTELPLHSQLLNFTKQSNKIRAEFLAEE